MDKVNAAGVGRWATLVLSLAFAIGSQAKVTPGENLVRNGRLDSDQMEVPALWHLHGGLKPGAGFTASSTGGPGGAPTVQFAQTGKPCDFTLRQYDLKLVPGARYRISAQVRTRNFRSSNAGVMVINAGWRKTAKLNLPASTEGWKPLVSEIVMIPSTDVGRYSVAIHASGFTGELMVADVRLEALDASACDGSAPSNADGDIRQPRLVPRRPLLCRIPSDRREVVFGFYGQLPGGVDGGDYEIVLTTSDVARKTNRTLRRGENVVPLPTGATKGLLRARILSRKDGSAVTDDEYRFAVVDPVPPVADCGRRLNNLVRELVNAPVRSTAAAFDFALPRDGWVFVRVTGAAGAAATVDGQTVLDADSLNGETFRHLAAGRHVLKVAGAMGGSVVVRAIAEIFNYPICCDSCVAENGSYGWDFAEKHVLPASTTQNAGKIPESFRSLFRQRGGRWLANLGTTSIADANDLVSRLKGCTGLNEPWYDGVTCDEQFFGHTGKLAAYAEGLRRFNAQYSGERLIYTWIVGKAASPGLDEEFASACLNASRGRGRMISEIYCRTKATEAEADAYLADYLVGTMKMFSGLCADAAASTGIILGNFTQIPILSLVHHPEVDYKYYLDRQLNLVANDPAFAGLGCTGYWGSYYADEEHHRWSMALLRHYCVEGATTMLSEKYGYRYLPGHLVNGDFRTGLEGWRPIGAVAHDSVPRLGALSECRWGGSNGLGDAFAVLKGDAALEQRVKGLVPGRRYVLQACVFDAKDARVGRFDPRRIPLELSVGVGGKTVADKSWRHIDRRPCGAKKACARINLVRVVFAATSAETVVSLSSAAAPDTAELGVNGVSLNPYYD